MIFDYMLVCHFVDTDVDVEILKKGVAEWKGERD